MQWKIAKELEGARGIEFARERMAGYDFSRCEWITVRRGGWGGPGTRYSEERGGWTNAVAGVCRHPSHASSGLYRLNCRVNARTGWPGYLHQRVSPLYRNPDGSWPEAPADHMVGQWWEDPETGREWKRLYRKVALYTEDEALVYIIAHEAYHYLRRERQVPGKNTEIDADAFGEGVLEEFRLAQSEGLGRGSKPSPRLLQV
jgi:hypothetical protein